ncbi:MAG: hypothetical protein V2B19_22410 [Pseudomonadota bacterium]
MHSEEILHSLTKPFIIAGIYKDEKSALTDIALDYVRRKIEQYDSVIVSLKRKYGVDFDQFTEAIKNNASLTAEDDWMEWKGAIEMRRSWENANRMIISNE